MLGGKGYKVTLRLKKKVSLTAAAAAALQVALGQHDMTMPQFLSSDPVPTVAGAVADGAPAAAGDGAAGSQ
jgi:hypothetical protein